MKKRKIFIYITSFLLVILFQNCGPVDLGILPSDASSFKANNGGGYSGLNHGNHPGQIDPPREEMPVVDNNSQCFGMLSVYSLVGSSCENQKAKLNELSKQNWYKMLATGTYVLGDEDIQLPTTSLSICNKLVRDYIYVVNLCEAEVDIVEQDLVKPIDSSSEIIIEGEIYELLGIKQTTE